MRCSKPLLAIVIPTDVNVKYQMSCVIQNAAAVTQIVKNKQINYKQ